MTLTYLTIADDIEADIKGGRLEIGACLPPQRTFAYTRNIAASTAGRVYRELGARGLVTGEIGRGTFVCDPSLRDRSLLTIPAAPVDFAINYPVLADQSPEMIPALTRMLRPDVLDQIIRVGPKARETESRIRDTILAFLGLATNREVLFTGSGRQAIGCAIDALVPPSGALAVEEWTYPIALKLARRLGRRIVPVAMDEQGVRPDALEAAYAHTPFRCLYVQPTIHNPTTITMPTERRHALLASVQTLGVKIIEDRTYRFLGDQSIPSLADIDGNVVTIDSFSKQLAPGLSVGVLTSGSEDMPSLEQCALEMGWTAQGFATRMICEWIQDGTLNALAIDKRNDAVQRRQVLHEVFNDTPYKIAADGYHAWLQLPTEVDPILAAQTLSDQGIAITTDAPYAATPSKHHHFIRLALSRVEQENLLITLQNVCNALTDQ